MKEFFGKKRSQDRLKWTMIFLLLMVFGMMTRIGFGVLLLKQWFF
ncbi:hypothetical protein [Algoriphagus limi]|uniref:DUF4044 domain-containing protein n=1 Tax=Algoriphagus limi TaxID=2975273 RepID=A0ABT2G5C9_9BACT|nr:hypothetical protein [Algoriphagus limi]MCS5490409.1 hypothetical protein [Algoriphagus limi]